MQRSIVDYFHSMVSIMTETTQDSSHRNAKATYISTDQRGEQIKTWGWLYTSKPTEIFSLMQFPVGTHILKFPPPPKQHLKVGDQVFKYTWMPVEGIQHTKIFQDFLSKLFISIFNCEEKVNLHLGMKLKTLLRFFVIL